MRTKNLENNILILQVILDFYEKTSLLEIRRSHLFDASDTAVLERNDDGCGLGHSTFNRILREFEDEMIIILKRPTKAYTIIAFNLDRVKKKLNDIRYSQGFYRQDVRVRANELEPSSLQNIFQKIGISISENYHRPWITHIDEKSQYAYLISERCASELAAILIASRFSFTFSVNDSHVQSIENPDLAEILIVSSKFASKHLEEPFKLLIEYSGVPISTEWGKVWITDMWQVMSIHFQEFARRVFNFKLNQSDLINLERGSLDSLSAETRRLFDIFYKNYVLPTIRAMNSKTIKFE